ncbi:TonB-dependent receptor [Emticicia fluvialis]|uniref:TonB-dependent receptor n=1 Tax=Emticicia fluvialis TaxID=2974474 RepID=UPI00216631B4|nr:carboxypeptidase regulatory-like domain-containing protein [Emticicia fluvialis]
MMQKSTFLRGAFSLLVGILFAFQGFAQVTTSSITGLVTDTKGDGLPGATVVAVHVPSGTKYGTVTNATGRYTIPAVRIGGPYKVTFTFVGFKDLVKEGIIASLGSAANVDASLSDEGTILDEIKITSSRSDIFSSDRTGASTTISKQALQSLPTIGSRSINDFTKYNPQGNGRSFGGQDSRLNNFTVDGSVFNNGFGLGSEAQAGGRTNSTAISLDAIEEVQINVAPFDVRQSGFVGAGLNAVTRSGTNEVTGSVYHSFRNNSKTFVGTKAEGFPVTSGTFDEKVLGFRVGAPIIKNKLFIFVNGEFQRRTVPASAFVAKGSNAGNPTRVEKADIEEVSALVKQKFGYETGPYENYDDETSSDKFLARLDYNINDKHKATVRYTFHNSQDYVTISNSSSAGFGNRITANSLSFKNSGYFIQDNTRSIVGELNSTFGGKAANNFIIGYDHQNEDRAYAGSMFPTIDILNNNATYISVGFDPFTPSNKLNYGTFHITDNFTLFKNKHTLTFGTNYENYKSNNLFFPASNGVWVYNSLDDFRKAMNGDNSVVANMFQYRYSALPGGADPLQVLKVNKFDLYAQDEYQVSRTFKLTYGVRASVIAFGNTALENSVISAQTYKNMDGASYKVNTGTLPDAKILWEPRVGFNWDVTGNRSTQVRGGTGIFTGRPPYVFVSNQIGNNGILTGFIDQRNTSAFPFVKDASVYTPPTPTLPSTFDIAATDANYKFPQVWKTNLAVDQKLPFGLVGSVDFIYNKFLNSVLYFDANLETATGKFNGPDTRDRFPGSGLTGSNLNNAIRINDNVSRAAILTSKNAGENVMLTFKLERPWTKGFYAMFAYTYAKTRDLMSAGSIASGSFTGARSVNGNNKLGLSYSDNDIPHRLVGTASYRIEYGGKFGGASQVSLGYVGGTGTGRYSYTIAGDMNGDGIAGNDLLFVPLKASDLRFVNTTVSGTTYTAEQQAAAFDKFIDQDPYLSKMRGKYVERNGAILPWLHQFDLSYIQEFFVNVKGKRNTFQIRADIQNFGNLLNGNWGIGKFVSNASPLAFASVTTDGIPQYRLNTQTSRTTDGKTITTKTELLKDTFQSRSSATDVWNAQLTLRYIFN